MGRNKKKIYFMYLIILSLTIAFIVRNNDVYQFFYENKETFSMNISEKNNIMSILPYLAFQLICECIEILRKYPLIVLIFISVPSLHIVYLIIITLTKWQLNFMNKKTND